jgi:hypothetical protein
MYKYGMAPPVVILEDSKDYKFSFWSNEFVKSTISKPIHVHVEQNNEFIVEFWLHAVINEDGELTHRNITVKSWGDVKNPSKIQKRKAREAKKIIMERANFEAIVDKWDFLFKNIEFKSSRGLSI